MKLISLFAFSTLLLLCVACNPDPGKRPHEEDDYIATLPDSSQSEEAPGAADYDPFTDDTTFTMRLEGKTYALMITRDEFRSETGSNTGTITVRIIDGADTLLRKTLDFNVTGILRNPAPGEYWLSLLNSGGGSGFSATLFRVKIHPKPELQALLNFNELSSWKTNKIGTELILFEGHWDMSSEADDADPEAHFSPHRQDVLLCSIGEDAVTVKELGQTVNKYDFSGDEFWLDEFRKQEPEIAKAIHWEDYNLNVFKDGPAE